MIGVLVLTAVVAWLTAAHFTVRLLGRPAPEGRHAGGVR